MPNDDLPTPHSRCQLSGCNTIARSFTDMVSYGALEVFSNYVSLVPRFLQRRL